MLKKTLLILLLLSPPLVHASAYKNHSGVYACKGNNNKVGDYQFTLTLKLNKLNKLNSRDNFNVYDVTGKTENATNYFGKALANGNKMSLAFRISDYKDNTFGVGMAVFKLNQAKSWTFTTQYYEPGDNDGISGTEVCAFQAPLTPKKLPDEPSQS